jgi:protein-L-isoaspartate(D-aspartate) O-methyltransferase
MRNGDATEPIEGAFDAVLVNVGVTHPQNTWLDALVPGGRMILPLTATLPAVASTLGMGVVMHLTRHQTGSGFDVQVVTFISIYSGVGLRDERLNTQLGQALARRSFQMVTRLRRDPHDLGATCCLHGPNCCFASA